MTPRQREAFEAFKMARERIAMIEAVPCRTAEDSKARWERLKHAEQMFKEAFEELDASIIDAMSDEPAGGIEIIEAPGDRCHGLKRIETPEGAADCPGCRACS